MKIGVMMESFRKPFEEVVRFAGSHGIAGIQLHASRVRGDEFPHNPDLLSASPEELKKTVAFCERNGVTVSAVCGDVSELSFQVEKETMQRAEFLKRVVDQTAKMGVRIITTHIGHVPESTEDPVYPLMVKGVREAAEYAAKQKCIFAIETGPELADVLKHFIETVGSAGLGVNLDPANLRGVSQEDPVFAVQTLAPYIVHTHAKDSICTHPGSAAKFYKLRNPDGSLRNIPARATGFQEVPLGTGMVPWDAYLAELKKIGFDGFLTIERECGDDPAADIMLAADFLKGKLA